MTVTTPQIRAARSLLGWTQLDLAQAVGVVVLSVKRAEGGAASADMWTRIVAALEHAGIEFLPEDIQGEGVRFRKPRR